MRSPARACAVLVALLWLLVPSSIAGAASADPSSFDFGAVPLNTTVSKDVSITLDAGYVFSGAGGISALNAPYNFGIGTCGTATGPGSCSISESFTPTAVGAAPADLTAFECPTGGGACLNIPVHFDGSGVSVAAATPASWDFGAVPLNTTVSKDVSITLDTGYVFSGAGGISALNAPYNFGIGTCGTATGPGSCSISESFTPTAVGAAPADLTAFECPVHGGACLNIPVHFDGSGVSVAAATPASWDFGAVPLNTTAGKDVSIRIDTGYSFGGAGGISALNPPYNFGGGTCGSFTGPGSCSIHESFTPTVVGPASADLTVFECPLHGGACLNIPVHFDGHGVTPLSITTTGIPGGTVGTAYPATTLQATGGVTPYHWAVTGGGLPGGLTLDGSTGALSGTPTTAGSFTFTVTVTDSGAPTPQTATATYSMTIVGTADLAVELSAQPSPAQNKKPVTFTIGVTNHGPNTAAANLTDVLPAGSAFSSLTTSQGSCTTPHVGSTGTVTCALGNLASGATATVQITVSTTTNKATISDTAAVAVGAFTVDPVSANNTGTVDVKVK